LADFDEKGFGLTIAGFQRGCAAGSLAQADIAAGTVLARL